MIWTQIAELNLIRTVLPDYHSLLKDPVAKGKTTGSHSQGRRGF